MYKTPPGGGEGGLLPAEGLYVLTTKAIRYNSIIVNFAGSLRRQVYVFTILKGLDQKALKILSVRQSVCLSVMISSPLNNSKAL